MKPLEDGVFCGGGLSHFLYIFKLICLCRLSLSQFWYFSFILKINPLSLDIQSISTKLCSLLKYLKIFSFQAYRLRFLIVYMYTLSPFCLIRLASDINFFQKQTFWFYSIFLC